MTLFQARYVQFLTLSGCSLRATAAHYYDRYDYDGNYKRGKGFDGLFTYGGNQIDGIELRKEAIKVLRENNRNINIGVYDN